MNLIKWYKKNWKKKSCKLIHGQTTLTPVTPAKFNLLEWKTGQSQLPQYFFNLSWISVIWSEKVPKVSTKFVRISGEIRHISKFFIPLSFHSYDPLVSTWDSNLTVVRGSHDFYVEQEVSCWMQGDVDGDTLGSDPIIALSLNILI